jgi:hypothetical protein
VPPLLRESGDRLRLRDLEIFPMLTPSGYPCKSVQSVVKKSGPRLLSGFHVLRILNVWTFSPSEVYLCPWSLPSVVAVLKSIRNDSQVIAPVAANRK